MKKINFLTDAEKISVLGGVPVTVADSAAKLKALVGF